MTMISGNPEQHRLYSVDALTGEQVLMAELVLIPVEKDAPSDCDYIVGHIWLSPDTFTERPSADNYQEIVDSITRKLALDSGGETVNIEFSPTMKVISPRPISSVVVNATLH